MLQGCVGSAMAPQPALFMKKRRNLASSLLIQILKYSCFISSASVGGPQRNGTRLHYEQALRLRALSPHCPSGRCACTLTECALLADSKLLPAMGLHSSQTQNFSLLRVCIPRRLRFSPSYGSAFRAGSVYARHVCACARAPHLVGSVNHAVRCAGILHQHFRQ